MAESRALRSLEGVLANLARRQSHSGFHMWVLMLVMLTAQITENDFLRDDEVVTFYTSAACRSERGDDWIVPIHGWLYEPEEDSLKRRALLAMMGEFLDLEDRDISNSLFNRRAQKFLVDDVQGRRLSIAIGNQLWLIGPSDRNGYIHGQLEIPAELARSASSSRRILDFRVLSRVGDPREFSGHVHLIEPRGISVISDIDDTIKLTGVHSRRKMLENTFLKEYRAVDGISNLYRRWSRAGAAFHYVSASPWQLYDELCEFLKTSDFPGGSTHLKHVSLSRDPLELFQSPREMKIRIIEELISVYPQRRFILIGDSGQEDPSIFADIARRHRERILYIAIRAVDVDQRDRSLYEGDFHGLPPESWQIFCKPEEITVQIAP